MCALGTDPLDSATTPWQSLQTALSQTIQTDDITDLFTLSLRRVTLFKRGAAFSEHSPLLHNLTTMSNWSKPHSGLRKMFLGEVVGKRVVVQGLWVGGWCWGPDLPKPSRKDSQAQAPSDGGLNSTKAPWAR